MTDQPTYTPPLDDQTPSPLALFTQTVVISMRQLALMMVNPFREAYRLAGAPYGDTDEGLGRWLGELREGIRQDVEAEYERQRAWVIEDTRRQVEARRGRPSS